MAMCDATWDSNFEDDHYGVAAHCERSSDHDDDHSGPVTWWTGHYEKLQDGVRLCWPHGGADHEVGGRS